MPEEKDGNQNQAAGCLFLLLVAVAVGYCYHELKQAKDNALDKPQPRRPSTEREIENAIRGSDDLDLYRAAFIRAARELIESGVLTVSDFRAYGGWVRSAARPGMRGPPWYFVDEDTTGRPVGVRHTRAWLNARTGRWELEQIGR